METFKISWRNVWRNKRRSIVTIAAMCLALFVMILYSSLAAGMLDGLERNILDLEMGDMQIFHKDFQDDPSLFSRIEDPGALLSKLDKAGYGASPRLIGAGLAAGEDTSAGVMLRGVDVQRDKKVSLVYQSLQKGEWLDPADHQGVVLGKRLAQTLNVKLGDEIVVLSQGADGSTANEIYKVSGILKSIADVVDRTGVYMTGEAFRELLVMPEGAHQLIVRKIPGQDLDTAAAAVREIAPGLDVKTWKELLPTLSSMLDSHRGTLYVMFLIVYIAIGIVILNAMLMAVFERIREFGVLKALGMGPGRVFRLIFLESLIQTGMAVAIATTLSLPGLWYLVNKGIDMGSIGGMAVHGMAFDPIVYGGVNANVFLGPIITLLIIVLLAIMYPAIKAALIRPVEAIYHQ